MIFLNKCFVLSLFAFGFATAHAQTTVTIFEFYNSNLKQYFRTASAGEAQAIDGGAAGAGWSRTGDNFSAWTADSAGADLVDVCRFYGSQSPGPNSHFFTASAAECAALKSLQQSTPASQPRWNFEGVAFKAKLTAANGLCAAGTTPIYRSYNKGNAKGIDSNHRFTTQLSEYDRLNASGWAGEGVVMCVNAALTQAASTTSWKRLVEKVITPQCASCHSATGTGAQSGLRLDGNAAEIYKLLINVAPTNAGAAGHGMKRIVPGKSNDSFFYTKLLQWNPAITHAFGSPMPLGSQSLPVGTLEFIKQWIDAGASEASDALPVGLLDDTTLPSYVPFSPLTPPANGFQLKIEPFSVSPKFEREIFVYRTVGNTAPLYINQIDTRMRVNSHHFVLYTLLPETPAFVTPVPGVIRDLRNADNSLNFTTALTMGYHVYLGGSMTPNQTYTFPPGVGLEIPANAGIDLNAHYVNTGAAAITGEAYANFHTVDRSKITHVARTLNLNNTSISIAAGERKTISKSFTFNEQRTIVMLTSHMHKLGEKFVIRIAGGPRNGEIVYETTDWSHPFNKTFDPPLVIPAGQGLTSEVTYYNTTTRTVNFGLTSEDEMGIIFGYYY